MIHNPFQKIDEQFMHQALAQAQLAAQQGEVPVGAVVVDADGVIIAQAYNQVEQDNTQCAHAEMLALKQAGDRLGTWRLEGCWLYVTLEPCAMCMSLIRLSRVSRVVFGASSPLFGYRLDKDAVARVYKVGAPEIVSGVGAGEATSLMKRFFKKKRNGSSEQSN